MPRLLFLALASFSLAAAAQHDASRQKTGPQEEESASGGASSDTARARAGSSASVEGGAALGATGIDSRPAAKAEQAEKEARRNRRKGDASAGATRDSRPGSLEAEEAR